MASLREFGYKVFTLINENPSKRAYLCKQLNFSENDLTKLTYGRLAVTPEQIRIIADIFSQTPESLFTYKNNDSYSSMVHSISPFSSQENCNEILDIIDSYIDIKEANISSNMYVF